MINVLTSFLCVWLLVQSNVFSQTRGEDWPVLTGPYLGQNPPGKNPEIFAPGIVSAEGAQGYPSFTRDGKEFYFYCGRRGGWFHSQYKDGGWQAPAVVPFSSQYGFGEAIVSPDGSKLLFCTKLRQEKDDDSDDLDLWMMKRRQGEWQEPTPLDSTLNSCRNEAFPTSTLSGNIYFFREYEENGSEILVSEYSDGAFAPPEILGPAINTEKDEYDPFVDPGERYLIYCARDREDGFGKNDLYISFKTEAGAWTQSVNLGPAINSESEEISPHVSPDGNYLFFSSEREGSHDIYWVDAGFIEDLKRQLLTPELAHRVHRRCPQCR
jgi:Tol biopolymer transport system component